MKNIKYDTTLGERINDGKYESLFSDDFNSLFDYSDRLAFAHLSKYKGYENEAEYSDKMAKDWAEHLTLGVLIALYHPDKSVHYFGLERQLIAINNMYFMLEDKHHYKTYHYFCDSLSIDPTAVSESTTLVRQSDDLELTSKGFYYDGENQPYAVSFIVTKREQP